MTNPEFVALGTRCTAATILNLTDTRKNAYPFDWVDTPIENILKLVQMPYDTPDLIGACVSMYLDNVRSQRHHDGTWLPHDFIPTDDPVTQLIGIKDKYIRRFKRLFDLFESGRDIVFLTVFTKYDKKDIVPFDTLSSYLFNKIKCKDMLFITINLEDYKIHVGNWINFVVPFADDWPAFDAEIIAQLKDNHITKQFFK